MKKTLVAVVLIAFSAVGCKKQVNTAKLVPVAIHEVVDCSAVQAIPVKVPRSNVKLCVAREAIVTEKQIRAAAAGHNHYTELPQVMLYLDRTGAARMYEATQRISARHGHLAILIDGVLSSVPVVNGPIEDSLIIEGGLTESRAQDLANLLNGG